jgi:Flp pilus assembly protein TadG
MEDWIFQSVRAFRGNRVMSRIINLADHHNSSLENQPNSPAQTPLKLKRAARLMQRFRRNSKGATAIEFALVAMPFTALMFAVIETALIFWSGQVLETALATASREIFTGQTATAGTTAAQFKTKICDNVPGLFDCNADISVDVRSFPDNGSAIILPPMSKDGAIDSGSFGFNQGTAGSIVVVRAALGFKFFTSFIAPDSSNLNGNKRLIVAASVFKNEPFNP